jgi:hypothetical protein
MALTEAEAKELAILKKDRDASISRQQQVAGPETTVTDVGGELPQEFTSPGGLEQLLAGSALPIVGGTIGAVLGAPGGPVTAAAGGGLGAAGGEALSQIGQQMLGFEGAPTTSLEAAKQIGEEAIVGSVAELGGQAVARAGGAVLKKVLKPKATEVVATEDFLKKVLPGDKPTLLPGERTRSTILTALDNVAEGSFGSKIPAFKEQRAQAFDNFANQMVDELGDVSIDDLGILFTKSVTDKHELSKVAARPLYNAVEEASGNVNIDITPVKDFAAKELGKVKGLKGLKSSAAGDTIIEAVSGLPNEVSFSTARELRSRVIALADEFSVTNPKARAIGLSKQISSKVDDAITGTLKETNPEMLDTWLEANKIWKDGNKQFNNTFIRRLLKQGAETPEAIFGTAFKKNAISNIKKAKDAITTPEGQLDEALWRKFQQTHLDTVLQGSKSANEGLLKGSTIERKLFGREGIGDKALDELYSKAQQKDLRGFVNAIKATQKRPITEAFKQGIMFTQIGATAGIIVGAKDVEGGLTILGTPAAISWLMVNPKIAKSVLRGAGKTTTQGMTRLINSAITEHIAENDEPLDITVIGPETALSPSEYGKLETLSGKSNLTPAENVELDRLQSKKTAMEEAAANLGQPGPMDNLGSFIRQQRQQTTPAPPAPQAKAAPSLLQQLAGADISKLDDLEQFMGSPRPKRNRLSGILKG